MYLFRTLVEVQGQNRIDREFETIAEAQERFTELLALGLDKNLVQITPIDDANRDAYVGRPRWNPEP